MLYAQTVAPFVAHYALFVNCICAVVLQDTSTKSELDHQSFNGIVARASARRFKV